MKPRLRIHAAAVLAACVLVATPAAAQTVMQPGAWQMEMTVSAKNPQTGETVKVGESKATLCLTAEFLAKQPYFTPDPDERKMRERGAQCVTSDFARKGNTASWKMTCVMSDGNKVDATVKNVVEAQKLTSEMHQIVTQGDRAVPVGIQTQGTFVGDCTPDMGRP